MSRRHAFVALPLVLLVGLLAACTEPASIPPAEPPAATEPLFASDEEALEAATAAYEEYLAVLDAVLQDPKPLTNQFDGVAGQKALDLATESVQQFVDDQVSITGPRRLGAAELQQVINGPQQTEVVAYFCEDVTGVLLTDSSGNSITTADRPDFARFEVTVQFAQGEEVVIEREFWDNVASCD